jgi:nitrate reductase gamma subunit
VVALSIVHAVIPGHAAALFLLRRTVSRGAKVMSKLFKILIPLTLVAAAMTGCVVAPAGYYHRGYYGPRVAVVAPAPVVVVRAYP